MNTIMNTIAVEILLQNKMLAPDEAEMNQSKKFELKIQTPNNAQNGPKFVNEWRN